MFLEPLKRAAACIGTANFTLDPHPYEVGETHLWILNDGRGVHLRGEHDLWLDARMNFEIADRGRSEGDQRFKVRTTSYLYTVRSSSGQEVLAAHWHPVGNSPMTMPHYHIEGPVIADTGVFGKRAHIPSGRVSFEWVVRFAIENMKVEPACQDWNERLSESDSLFREHRTWP